MDITVSGVKSCTPWTGDILRKRWNATSSKQFQLAIVWKILLEKRVGWLFLDFLPTVTEIKIDICYLFLWCAEVILTLCVLRSLVSNTRKHCKIAWIFNCLIAFNRVWSRSKGALSFAPPFFALQSLTEIFSQKNTDRWHHPHFLCLFLICLKRGMPYSG